MQNEIGHEYTLTTNTAQASRSRKMIAAQLFPRLTLPQQEALLERQINRKKYLENYEVLASSTTTGPKLLDELEHYINRPETPLSLLRKTELLEQLHRLRLFPEGSYLGSWISFLQRKPYNPIADFKETLCAEVQPTFFNVMKAMYPLLADVHTLSEAAYGKEKAGKAIGYFRDSIENVIAIVKTNHSNNSALMHLAEHVEEQIASIEDPSFFGFHTSSSEAESPESTSSSSESNSSTF
jgi:hypothetical protein